MRILANIVNNIELGVVYGIMQSYTGYGAYYPQCCQLSIAKYFNTSVYSDANKGT